MKYDLCFVDSPPGKREQSRMNTCRYALDRGIPIILHDAFRDGEQQTIQYFRDKGMYVEELYSDKGLIYIRP